MSLLNNEDSRPNTPNAIGTSNNAPPASSNSATTTKADQIAHRFFIKFLQILVSARSTAIENSSRSTRPDRWFNLETPDTVIHREHMRNYKSFSSMNVLPTFTLHVVLTFPDLGTNRALVAVDAVSTRLRIEPTPRSGVLLESWTITATPPSSSFSGASTSSTSLSSSESAEFSLSAVYKHAISLFRSIYTLTHTLPAAKLQQRYRQHPSLPTASSDFGIELRLTLDRTILTFDASPSPTRPAPLQTSTHAFPALSTPLGALKLTVRYLTRPNFRIDTIESLISSRLFNQDAGVEESMVAFTPTVVAHRARESAAASGGAGANGGTGLDVGSAAVAIRPLLQQRHSRTISFPAASGSGSGAAPLPLSRQQAGQDREREYSASASERSANAPHLLPSSSPRYAQFRDNLAFAMPTSLGRTTGKNSASTSTSPPSGISNLTRLHLQMGGTNGGTGTSSGTGTPGGTVGADGIRRPSLISPFKSSTFASSASGLNSPSSSLSRGLIPGTPNRTSSALPHAIPERGGSGAGGSYAWPSTSPQSTGVHFPSSDIPPPFAASSSAPRSSTLTGLGMPRSAESASAGASAGSTPPGGVGLVGGTSSSVGASGRGGKRYSSSFHRRAPSAGASAAGIGAAGAAGADLSGSGIGVKGLSSGGGVVPGGGRVGGSPLALPSELPVERSQPSSTLLDPTENEEDLSEFIRAIDESRQRGGSGLNTSRSSDSNSSSAAVGGQGHARRISLADRRHSPLIGRLELAPAPPSPRSPPARLQELNLFESEERTRPTSAPMTSGTSNNTNTGTPLDLGSKLQNMDDTFKKSMQGLKERRRGMNRAEPPPALSPAGTSSSAGDRRTAPDPVEEDPSGNNSRRVSTGPTFRLRGRGGSGVANAATGSGGGIASETELAPTPGESTASDGSGYAGIVGRMDMDSGEMRAPFAHARLRREPAEAAAACGQRGSNFGGVGDSSSSATERGSGDGEDGDDGDGEDDDGEGDQERRHREYEGDNEGTTSTLAPRERPERVSRYTSVLRRDGTARAGDYTTSSRTVTSTSTSSGSTPDPAAAAAVGTSRPRRPAMGWPSSSPPPP